MNSSIKPILECPILPVQFLSFVLWKAFHVHKEQQNEIWPFLWNSIRLTLLKRTTERKKMPTVRGDHKRLAERNRDGCLYSSRRTAKGRGCRSSPRRRGRSVRTNSALTRVEVWPRSSLLCHGCSLCQTNTWTVSKGGREITFLPS